MLILKKKATGANKHHKDILSIPILSLKKVKYSQVPHVYNPSYSGGRDQKDCGLKPAPGKIVHETLS
jgi:hypothetical protein